MSFSMIENGGVTFLRCAPMSGAVHGFSTRLGGVSKGQYAAMNLSFTKGDDLAAVTENHRLFAAAVGYPMEKLISTRQVHGDEVRVASLSDCGKGLRQELDYDCDALMTDIPNLPLMILTADCCPILLFDPVRRVVAAVHAGWRGTALGLAGKAVREMARVYGCKSQNIMAAIGPCISKCCFETDRDVADAMEMALGEDAAPFVEKLGEKYKIDMKGINRAFLHREGVVDVFVTEQCTACDTERYFSHRVMGDARGSLASVIMLPGVSV